MMMLIPEAWSGNPLMDKQRKAFYEYNAALMEPWDGPAAIAFTDGRQIGATLDRNGLRPARYFIMDDDTVVLASEAGTLPVDESKVVRGNVEIGVAEATMALNRLNVLNDSFVALIKIRIFAALGTSSPVVK